MKTWKRGSRGLFRILFQHVKNGEADARYLVFGENFELQNIRIGSRSANRDVWKMLLLMMMMMMMMMMMTLL
jgi:hypothetical protein